jgi:hypothetical protein
MEAQPIKIRHVHGKQQAVIVATRQIHYKCIYVRLLDIWRL